MYQRVLAFGISLNLTSAIGCVALEQQLSTNEVDEIAATLGGTLFSDLVDGCSWLGVYGDGICDGYCPKPDPDCPIVPLGPNPGGFPTRYPIVLAHGFAVSPKRLGFNQVAATLRADGHAVYEASVPPFDTTDVRGKHLAAEIDRALKKYGANKVNVIAHSMGGLDTRYVIRQLGYGDRVASVTTISSPHRGSRAADAALKLLPGFGFVDKALNALADWWGVKYSDLAKDSHMRAALASLAETNAANFNTENSDDPHVFYQSWAGVSSVYGIRNPADFDACDGKMLHDPSIIDKMDPLLVPIAAFTAHGVKLIPNDGMVTVESAKWGHFRGCIPADHADEIGQINDNGSDPFTGFNHLRFYRNIAYDLERLGY